MKPENPAERIELGGRGQGEVSEAMIERRALELAHADGRAAINEKDLIEARTEISARAPSTDAAEEAFGQEETAGAGAGTPPPSVGSQAPRVQPDDESAVPEHLVEEGLEEADHDTRVSASEDEELG